MFDDKIMFENQLNHDISIKLYTSNSAPVAPCVNTSVIYPTQGIYTSAGYGKDPGWSWSHETPKIYCLREPEWERESIKLHVST